MSNKSDTVLRVRLVSMRLNWLGEFSWCLISQFIKTVIQYMYEEFCFEQALLGLNTGIATFYVPVSVPVWKINEISCLMWWLLLQRWEAHLWGPLHIHIYVKGKFGRGPVKINRKEKDRKKKKERKEKERKRKEEREKRKHCEPNNVSASLNAMRCFSSAISATLFWLCFAVTDPINSSLFSQRGNHFSFFLNYRNCHLGP